MVRVKFRYIVLKIELENEKDYDGQNPCKFTDYSIYQCIMKNVEKYYGVFGVAAIRSGLKCKYCNEHTRIAIIRIKHRPHRFVSSILPLITVVGGRVTKFKTLYNGSTIMQCNKFIVEYQKRYLDKKIGQIKSQEARNQFTKDILNVSTSLIKM